MIPVKGEIPSPSNPPAGCEFHTRCPLAQEICRKQFPVLEMKREYHMLACHLV
ncbi:oligopeptide/dipeptide ABC transporter ATP-binding protein [Cytobacillus oceanisediminis]|uniref:oligopeptide/dipeptide ABC transporter ATP-binding protein n=1 Tax=Cytobacillus oceanisediminis TaxID=665099 RepID=UPI0011A9B378